MMKTVKDRSVLNGQHLLAIHTVVDSDYICIAIVTQYM